MMHRHRGVDEINMQHCNLLLLLLSLSIQSWIYSSNSVEAFIPGGLQHRPKRNVNYLRFFAQNIEEDESQSSLSNRRRLLKSIGLLPFQLTSLSLLNDIFAVPPANAGGLVMFPCKGRVFANNYIFLRAGESLLEEEGVLSTNPLFLTNRDAALSTKGVEQVEETCRRLKEQVMQPTIVRYSLAAAAIDTADIVGKELKIGRSNLVPEFNFMDPRAVGKWDMLPLETTQSAIWAMDVNEAGNNGEGGRPPPNEDSTPHETLADQLVRLRQLISVLETQYSGDNILLIFPDGTGPALLECAIGGIPLNRVHEFEYQSAEARIDVNYNNVQKYRSSTPSDEYLAYIQRGDEELRALRDKGLEILNVRDQQYEIEQKLVEENKLKEELAAQEKKEKEAAAKQIQKAERRNEAERKVTSDDDEQKSNVAVIAGLTAVGGAGVLSLFGDGSNEQPVEEINGGLVDEKKDSRGEIKLSPSDDNSKAEAVTPLLDINKPISLPIPPSPLAQSRDEATSTNTVQDEVKEVATKKVDRVETKNQAPVMDDDGADAWLGALSDIMNEEDFVGDESYDSE